MTTASKVRKIVAAAIMNISLLLAVFLLIVQAGLASALIVLAIGAVIMLPLLLWPDKHKTKKTKQKKSTKKQLPKENTSSDSNMVRSKLKAVHLEGLPLAANVKCTLTFKKTVLAIFGSGTEYELPYSRVTSMQTLKDTDIQNQYISSLGGAIGGAVLFGTLGAMVGGRTKKKDNCNKYILLYYHIQKRLRNKKYNFQN